MGRLGQGHWLGEWAASDPRPAVLSMITEWLPLLQIRYPHSRREKGVRGIRAGAAPFYCKAVALTRKPLRTPLHPPPADFHLTLSLARMGHIVSYSCKGTWESKPFGWASCCSSQIWTSLEEEEESGFGFDTTSGWSGAASCMKHLAWCPARERPPVEGRRILILRGQVLVLVLKKCHHFVPSSLVSPLGVILFAFGCPEGHL